MESRESLTEHVQEPRIEGTPRCDVVGVVLQEKIHMFLESPRQHERSQVLSHFRRSAAASFSKCGQRTSIHQTYVVFRVDSEKSEPSSSQLPAVVLAFILSATDESLLPVIIGTFDTWPRTTACCGGSVKKTPST